VLVQFIADDNCADRNHRPHPRDSGNGLVGRTSRESLSAEEPTVQELGHCLNAPVPQDLFFTVTAPDEFHAPQ